MLRPSPRLLRPVALTALVCVVMAAACGDDDTSPEPASRQQQQRTTTNSTNPTDSITTTPETPEAGALSAYREFWSVFDAYAAEAAPFDPVAFQDRFSPVATGGEYDHLYDRFQLDRARGLVSRGGEADVYRPKIVESSDLRVVVEDCADDTGGIYDTKTDTVVEPETPGARSFLRVVLVRTTVDDRWKVTSVGGEDTECDA